MLERIFVASVFGLSVAFCHSAEAQSINGNWSVQTGIMHGKTVPAGALASMSLSINNTNFEAKSGSMVSSGALGANTLATPAKLEFTINQGADKGRKLKAIYELQNGELKITFSETDAYPTAFESSAENKYLALSYKSTGASTLTASSGSPTAANPPGGAPPRRSKRNMSPKAQGN